jgi:type I restriction enzyme S subunit
MIAATFKKAKLKDVCSLVTDGTHDTPKTLPAGMPFIKAKEITGGVIDFENCEYISYDEHLKVIARSKPEFGDTLFAHIGASLGEAALIKTKNPFSIKNVALFKPDPAKIDCRYLYYQIIGPAFQGEIKNRRTGSAQPFVGLDQLRNHEIQVHANIHDQQKIASILSAYDDLIENNTRRIKILEEMAQAICRHWFVDFKFPGHKKAKFINSKLGKIPEGWDVKALGDLVTTQYGYTESTQEDEVGPKFLRGMDINKSSYIDWSCVPYCPIDESDYEKFRLSEGDIVIIRMADPGKIGIVEKDIEAVFASYLVRLRIVSEKLAPYFLFYFLLSDRYQAYVTGASTGTTRKSVSAGVMTGIDMVIPSRPLIEAFEHKIGAIRQLLNNLLERNANLRRTRDMLLPKLISGEVDVSKLEIESIS